MQKENSMEPKKNIIMRIYQILEKYTDIERHLTQSEIIDILYKDYGIVCERKAVGRNISFLKEMGFDIESDKSGSYLASRKLDNAELRLLIDSVLCSRNINSANSQQLIDKLISLGTYDFKSFVKHVIYVKDLGKSENKQFFLNIELVDEAIEKGKKIAFMYNKVGLDKRLHPTNRHTASPYQMILHNQRYYLMLFDDLYGKVSYYRLDKITDMEILSDPLLPIKSVPGYERGIDYRKLVYGMPYMFSDAPVPVTIKCPDMMADALNDWFGDGYRTKRCEDGYFIATLTVSEQAMLYWALQYNLNVEVLSPESLRDKLRSTLKDALRMYE